MTHYMLDTKTINQLIGAHPTVSRRVTTTPMASLRMSAITHGERLFGMADTLPIEDWSTDQAP